ncbi:MAG: YdcF family protein [Acidobacteriota bacterium]|nr:YdcF family protein [Acidobacteriota bacterium]
MLAIIITGLLVVSGLLFVWPASQPLRRADAILALNGAGDTARQDLAVSLLRRGYAPVLLFSEGAGKNDCPHYPDLRIICFDPRPARTVGEIDEAARYARSHHLRSLLVVSGRAQTTRARMLARRCFPGPVTVVSPPTPWTQVPFQVVYEWGATIRAEADSSGCS